MIKVGDLTGVSRLSIRGDWELAITGGSQANVAISAPHDVEGRITWDIKDGRLRLALAAPRWRFMKKSEERARAQIVLPELRALELAGSCLVTVADFEGDQLLLSAIGASRVSASGSVYQNLALEMSGANRIDLSGLRTRDARINILGVGNLVLLMDGGALSGKFGGMGEVLYYGAVASETVEIMGMGRVKPGGMSLPSPAF